jgi:hypothetical protein
MIDKIMQTTDLKPLAVNVAPSLLDIADPASGSTSCLSSQLRIDKHDTLPPESEPPTVIIYGFSPSHQRASPVSKSKGSQRPITPPQPQQMSPHKAQGRGSMSKGKPENPSLKEILQSRQIREADAGDENAIETDEGSDKEDEWEDCDSESESTSLALPQVKSKGRLTAQRSTLTMQLNNQNSAAAFARSPWLRQPRTSPYGSPTLSFLAMYDPQSNQPLPVYPSPSTPPPGPSTPPPADSPHTILRKTRATELSASLHRHVW